MPSRGDETDVVDLLARAGEEVQVAGLASSVGMYSSASALVVGVAGDALTEHPADSVDQTRAVQPVSRRTAPEVFEPQEQ